MVSQATLGAAFDSSSTMFDFEKVKAALLSVDCTANVDSPRKSGNFLSVQLLIADQDDYKVDTLAEEVDHVTYSM